MTEPSETTTQGVYVHVPFCRTVCPYCDFAVVREGDSAAYTAALIGSLVDAPALPADTLYIGGGTPSRFPVDALAQVMAGLRERFGCRWREATLEVNPEDLSDKQLRAWRELGFDRLSVGVQRIDRGELKMLGRARSSVAYSKLLAMLAQWRESGGRTSVDMIYGIPGDTPQTVRRLVETLLDWPIDHLSAYALTVEPGTPWERAVERGLLLPPSDEIVTECYLQILSAVQSRDWDAYELSNFAAPGARAVHNCGYWLHRPCAAFGLGAAGLERTAAGAVRYRRPRQFAEFLSQPDGRVDAEWLGPHEIVAERLLTGLRSFVGVPSEWLRIWDSVAPHGWAERLRSEGAWIEGLLGITLAPERRMMAEAVAARWAADLDPLARSGHLPMLD